MEKCNRHPAGYWTLERVLEESKKFTTKRDFKRQIPSAYAVACQKGLIDSMTWLKNARTGINPKYTKEFIKEIIERHNCITLSDLIKTNAYAYKIAVKNNWLADYGLIVKKHEDGCWTVDRVWALSKKYTNKKDFQKRASVAYRWASHYGLLDKMDWMKSPTYDERRNNHDSEVYVYLDEENKVVYVGLSVDTNNRKRTHRYGRNSAVKKYFGKDSPEPLVLKTNLTIDESAYWEGYYVKKYREDGYTLLNIAGTGLGISSIGGISKWSSKEAVIEESLKYHSRSEFKRKSGGAYNHALSNGWLGEMTWLTTPKVLIKKWTRENVFEESHKYQYRGEFSRGSQSAYNVARRNGWLNEMIWLKEKHKPTHYWTKERVFEESHKYTNRRDFVKNAKSASFHAVRNGWIKQMPWLKPLPLGHITEWTRDRIIEESKKYSSRCEFARKSPTAYQHALKDKSVFFEMPWLKAKLKPNGWWNDKSRVMEEGKKYKNRRAFSEGSYTAWRYAKRNGWIDEMYWFEKRYNK
ncbi:MAG: GIY-YIG nuclease family protein [Bacteroidales bacterium]|nr:GIY-YIG nuclease family protein [Bacteroidales bacterium]